VNDDSSDVLSVARVDAAEAVRDLVHALSAHDADDAVLDDVTDAVRGLVAELAQAPRRARVIPEFGDAKRPGSRPSDRRRYAMADRAVAGPANPTSIEIRDTRMDGNEAIAEVVFGPAFEGALGRVHGGMVAAAFDDLAGHALSFAGRPGFSVRLEVMFRAPVPVEVPVEFRVRMREQRGRKVYAEGEATLDGQVLATTEVVFVTVAQDHFETHAHELLGRERPNVPE
jgi:acyl-coenzyme A thioesterase PaaI-like protein